MAEVPLEGLAPALHHAVETAQAEEVGLLLGSRADASARGPKGVSPLHAAAFAGDGDVLRLLIESRADLEVRDQHGQTPLFFAPRREVCALLVDAKADVDRLNKKGQTALHMAANAGIDEVVEWLCGRMSPGLINAQDKHGRTALWCAERAAALLEARGDERAKVLRGTAALLEARGASARIKPHKAKQEKPFNSRKVQLHATSSPCAASIQTLQDEADVVRQLRLLEAEAEAALAGSSLASARRCESAPPGPPAVPDEEAKRRAAVRIQARARGLRARERVRQKLVPKVERDGCTFWEVVLGEEGTRTDPFGFSFVSGKVEFAKRLGEQAAAGSPGPEALLVKRVASGYLLDKWNLAHPDADVITGDRVVEVNGVTGVRGMTKELRGPTVKMLVAQYPEWFHVELAQVDAQKPVPFGVEWEKVEHESLKELKVTAVSPDGLLEASNRRFIEQGLFHYVVFPGMRIEAVSGVTGDVDLMSARLTEDPAVKLKIRRAEVGTLAREKLKRRLCAWRGLRFGGRRRSGVLAPPLARQD